MTTMIDVVANPYCAIDSTGIPQGTVATPGAPATHIGAMVDQVLTARTGKERFYFPLGGEKGDGVVRVPLTSEIARSVREGELLAATKRTLRLCGVPEEKFRAVEDALHRERERAAAKLEALNGDRDEEERVTLGEIPREATARKPEDDLTEDARRHFSTIVRVETADTKTSKSGATPGKDQG